jgi:hypothetical protein
VLWLDKFTNDRLRHVVKKESCVPDGEPCARVAERNKTRAYPRSFNLSVSRFTAPHLTMETAGLVIGVAGLAGLFTSCLEALDKLQSYQTFGTDSHVLDTRFRAAKARFERWGPGVGIEQGRLKHAHHSALDDKAVSDAVAELLHIIVGEICDADNVPPRRARGTGFDNKDSIERGRPMPRNAMHESKTKKLSWALWGKGKRTEQVEIFEKLVQQLHNLVPPSMGNSLGPARNPDAGQTNTLTRGTSYIALWDRLYLIKSRG